MTRMVVLMVFQMWSVLHVAYIVSPIVLALVLYRWTKHRSNEENRRLGIMLSAVAVLILIIRNIDIWIRLGFSHEIIPLQICHFANFVLLFSFLLRNQTLFALSFTLNLPAAYMAIIFANSLANYNDFFRIRPQTYFWGHLLIVVIALWAVMVKMVRIDRFLMIKTIRLIAILFVMAIVINNLLTLFGLNPNYFYAMSPENGTPLELFYNLGEPIKIGFFVLHPIYWVLTGVFALIIVFVFYLINLGIMWAIGRESSASEKTIAS